MKCGHSVQSDLDLQCPQKLLHTVHVFISSVILDLSKRKQFREQEIETLYEL